MLKWALVDLKESIEEQTFFLARLSRIGCSIDYDIWW